MQLRCRKDRAKLLHGIALEQTTRTSLRGVFFQTPPRLRMLRLPDRTLPGSGASGPPAHRTIRSQAVGSCLNNKFRGQSNHPFALKESAGPTDYWISWPTASDHVVPFGGRGATRPTRATTLGRAHSQATETRKIGPPFKLPVERSASENRR